MKKNENQLLITVIVPIYNGEDYLDTCIESITAQTYHNLEILLIDDGSTDGSLSICKKYALTDSRIRVIHKENEGLVKTRKLGISCGSGSYITFVDADDWINPDTYHNVLASLGYGLPDIVLYGLIEEYEDMSLEKRNTLPAGYYTKTKLLRTVYPQMLCSENFFQPGILPNLVCKMIKSDLLKNYQLHVDESIEIGEDADFTYQILMNACSLQILNHTPYHYRKRKHSMMENQAEFSQFRKLYLDLKATFLQNSQRKRLLYQLDQYMMFLLLLKKTDLLFLQSSLFLCLKNKKIALYGAGGFGQEVYRNIREQKWGEIVIWTDKKYLQYQEQNMDVCAFQNLHNREFDAVFIAILNTNICKEVKKALIETGINPQTIYYITSTNENIAAVRKLLEKDG